MRFAPIFALALAMATPILADDPARTINVTGEGSVTAIPDIATINVGVDTQADTAGAALTANSTVMEAVVATLAKAGIEPRDIQTQAINLSPVWDQAKMNEQGIPVISGYMASNSVSIRVRKLGDLGSILDQVGQAGANTINSVQFGLADPKPAVDEARKAAVADAMARAGLYAGAAGVTLGPVTSISESQPFFNAPMASGMARMESDAKAVPVASGELNITAQVSMTFGLTD